MSDEQRNPIIPVEQALVPFYGHEIVAVRLPDGRIAAVLNTLCDAIQLERKSQTDRIREDEILNEQLLLAQIETPGGPQTMNILTAWAIPTWLQGVRLSRVAPEKRAAILAFKREAADVLYRHFSERRPQLAAPGALVPAEPMTQPAPPLSGAAPTEWREWRQAMRVWLDWQDEMDRWREQSEQHQEALERRQDLLETRQDALEGRLEGVEELSRLFVEVTERLGPQTLSPEHQATVKAMATRLHQMSGLAYSAIYGDLSATFHVGKYGDIPETEWERVAEWFRIRIGSAEKRRASD